MQDARDRTRVGRSRLTLVPSPADLVYVASGPEAKTQAICSFNHAAVLIDLISWVVRVGASMVECGGSLVPVAMLML
jgi:hypothetical protein